MSEPRPAQKSAGAYRTISEVAADLKLPQHVLRFWETRFSQVKPLKRAGGRRFYRPEDVDLLRAVKTLLYGDGYTIKGVQRILREQGPRAVAALAASSGREPNRASAAVSSERGRRDVAEPVPPSLVGVGPDPRLVAEPRIAAPQAPADTEVAPLHDAAARLRAVLADLRDCAQLLASVRITTH